MAASPLDSPAPSYKTSFPPLTSIGARDNAKELPDRAATIVKNSLEESGMSFPL